MYMLTSLIPIDGHTRAYEVKQITVAFRTLGCKLNQCETAQMQEALTQSGYTVVDWSTPADIRVINTCTVTARSDKTCRREIRLAKRLDPDCIVAVAGCYAQVAPDVVAAIPGVDMVLGNMEKLAIADHLAGTETVTDEPLTLVSDFPEDSSFEREFVSQFHGHTRAFLKIQTGCDSHCAYCIIPVARGRARSMRQQQVLDQVRHLVRKNFREIVLTGINLGSWGRDTQEGPLARLLTALLNDAVVAARAKGELVRYRLSSIEPLEVDERLLDVIGAAGEAAAHHFHLPLQSGSDSVLRRMLRPYSPEEYLEITREVARRFPDAALGADVIVGFPGETDAEFEETLAFVEETPLTHLHVFAYSDRQGTPASAMRDKVHPDIIRERSLRLRSLGERKTAEFKRRQLGSQQLALILKDRDEEGRLVGMTSNYMEIVLPGDDSLVNRYLKTTLTEERPDGRWLVGPAEEIRAL